MRTGLCTPGLNSSGQKANAKTHTDDEVTLYGKIQIQDSVNVASLNFNNV